MLRDPGPMDGFLPANDDSSVWPVLNRELPAEQRIPAVVDEALAFRAAPSAPDVPAAVGGLLFAAYAGLVGALAIATAGPGESKFSLVIAALFVVAFFTVPRFILAQEPKEGARPTLHRFMARGMSTLTGHCSGGAALVQMLIVPAMLTLGVLAIAVEIALLT